MASSISGLGLDKIWEMICEYEERMKRSGFWEDNRAAQRLNWLEDQIQFLLQEAFLNNPKVKQLMAEEKQKIQSGGLNPGTLAKNLIDVFFSNETPL